MAEKLSTAQAAAAGNGPDAVGQGAEVAYIGDPSTATGSATYKDLTASYQNANDFDSNKDAVFDLWGYDRVLLKVDYEKSAGDDCQIKCSFGEADAAASCTVQETREDNSIAGEVRHETVVHKLTASFRGYIEVIRTSRFLKIEAKSGGTPDADDHLALAVIGQRRG